MDCQAGTGFEAGTVGVDDAAWQGLASWGKTKAKASSVTQLGHTSIAST